jgi:hypothetical protein
MSRLSHLRRAVWIGRRTQIRAQRTISRQEGDTVFNTGEWRAKLLVMASSFAAPNGHFGPERLGCFLTSRRERPPVSKPQKIVDLALSPAMILGRERIDASIDADVANKQLRALDEVRYLINGSSAETTFGSRHRRAPSLPR